MKPTHLLVLLTACVFPPQQNNYNGPPPMNGDGPPPSNSFGPPPTTNNAPPPPPTNAPPRREGGHGPVVVPTNIHSDCPRTVKVFFGEKPKFGSGTYSSISSNSTTGHTFRPGEMLWIVDDSENGISSVAIAMGMREIVISASCTQLSTR